MLLKEIGKYKASPDSKSDQLIQVPKCDTCGTYEACGDRASAAAANTVTITGFVFDGVTYSITPTLVTAPATIASLINAQIKKIEIDPVIEVKYDGTTLSVNHIGDGTLTSVTRSVGGTLATTRYCIETVICLHEIDVEGTVAQVINGSLSAALASNPYTYTGVPATDTAKAATLKTDMQTALTAVGQAYDSVNVIVDNASGRFNVKVNVIGSAFTTQIGTQKFVVGDCISELR